MIPLIIIGALAIAAIALASGNGKGGVYNILFQSPAPITASQEMVASAMGWDPNGVNSLMMNSPAPGSTVLTVAFRNDYSPTLPKVGQTINLFGVPATVRTVQRAPVSSGS